jgi:DNA-binding NtrC family response regulator
MLVIDDDANILRMVKMVLEKKGYKPHCVGNATEGLKFLQVRRVPLVLLDVNLPDRNGRDVLKDIKGLYPSTQVIMISAEGSVRIAVECLRNGAYDFIEKPFEIEEFELRIHHFFEKCSLEEKVAVLEHQLGERYKFKSIVGGSPAMQKTLSSTEMAAQSNINVLITGESGTGKELIARAIHINSERKDQPFVAVNCSAIPENLIESELFGYEKGAFTGANNRKIGKFEVVGGGTLFLDEIGELPIEMQVKLLRVLQEREIERLGGNEVIAVNSRFIFATNRNLKEMIKEAQFREDLYYRINVLPIEILPLRERREDIPHLLKYFFERFNAGKSPVEIAADAMAELVAYDWPGNVRELENFVERTLLVKRNDPVIVKKDVESLYELAPRAQKEMIPKFDELEKNVLLETLKKASGNVVRAATLLNISRDTVYRKIKKHSIDLKSIG